MVRLTSCSRGLYGGIEKIPKKLIGKKCPCSENDLSRAEREGGGGSNLLRRQRRNKCVRPVVARESLAQCTVDCSDEPLAVVRLQDSDTRQVLFKDGLR